MIELKKYTSKERTIAQNKAMELKQSGYFLTRICNENEELVAIGYKKSETDSIKEPDEKFIYQCNKSDFDFIYYNV